MTRRRIVHFLGLIVICAMFSAGYGIYLLGRIEEPFLTAIGNGREIPARESDQRRWRTLAPADLQEPPTSARLYPRFGVRAWSLSRSNMAIGNPNLSREQFQNLQANRHSFMLWSLDSGWPFPCVGGERWYEHRGFTATPVQYSGIKVGILRLPSRFLWAGMLVNGVLYAAVLALVWSTPNAIRSMVRRRRHQCANCGYPIGLSPLCTECGAPIPGRDAMRTVETRES